VTPLNTARPEDSTGDELWDLWAKFDPAVRLTERSRSHLSVSESALRVRLEETELQLRESRTTVKELKEQLRLGKTGPRADLSLLLCNLHVFRCEYARKFGHFTMLCNHYVMAELEKVGDLEALVCRLMEQLLHSQNKLSEAESELSRDHLGKTGGRRNNAAAGRSGSRSRDRLDSPSTSPLQRWASPNNRSLSPSPSFEGSRSPLAKNRTAIDGEMASWHVELLQKGWPIMTFTL